ncbi:MAG: HU family DNA-binding protein [Clostridia bacterium]|nr:HU family DNA-binding protein [Clostridia bacterium]
MNKKELIVSVAKKTGLSQKKSEAVVKATLASISEALAAGQNVSLIGFGSFSVKERAAHQGRNPRTGAKIKIKASKKVVFKAGSQLKVK